MKSRPIYSFGASISVIICLFAELAFSGAFRQVYAYAGNSAWLCVLIAGFAVTALLPIANKCNANCLVPIVGFIYLSLHLYRLVASASLLKQNKFIIYILVAAVVLAVISARFGMRGAGVYSAMSFIPVAVVFVICCLLGVKDYNPYNITPMSNKGAAGVIMGTVCAFSLMAVVLIPAFLIEQRYRRGLVITCAISSLSLSGSLLLGSLAFGISANEYGSVISEISKNVSVGKFFQRLEGLADVSYILSVTAAIVLVASLIGEDARVLTSHFKRFTVAGAFALIGAAVAYLSLFYQGIDNVMRFITVYSGVAVVAVIAFSAFKIKKTAMLALSLVPILLLCSCNAAGEIENQTYVVVTCYDSNAHRVAFVTENGDGTNYYSVAADDVETAVQSLEAQKSLKLSFEQMGLVLLSNDCNNISEWIDRVISSDMSNSAALYITDTQHDKIYLNQISQQESAFDYVSSLISSAQKEKLICRTVSKVNTMLSSNSTLASVGVIGESGVGGSALIDGDRVLCQFDITETILYNKMLSIDYTVKQTDENIVCVNGLSLKEQRDIADYIYNELNCDGLYLSNALKKEKIINRSCQYKFDIDK